MDTLLLIDGSNLLFQMFYGMPARIMGKQGRPVHGILGFVGALLKMIHAVQPSHAGIIFDGESENIRTQMDPAYKFGRQDFTQMPEEDTPFGQMRDLFHCLDILRIPYFETDCCEADDVLSSYALRYGGNCRIVIASQDSDLFQLITDHVQIFRYRGSKSVLCDKVYLQEKFGILPCQYASFKSLTGDRSDHIPGVPGVGPKTAAKLLNQYADLHTLYAHLDQIERPGIRAALQENRDRVLMNDRLIRLNDDAPLPFTFAQLLYHPKGLSTLAVLHEADLL